MACASGLIVFDFDRLLSDNKLEITVAFGFDAGGDVALEITDFETLISIKGFGATNISKAYYVYTAVGWATDGIS